MTECLGVKGALFAPDGRIVTIQRTSDTDTFPGLWDVPGGGWDAAKDTTPAECFTREVREELGLELDPRRITYERLYPSLKHAGKLVCFVAMDITEQEAAAIELLEEGLQWRFMEIGEYVACEQAVEPMQQRLQDYMSHLAHVAVAS